MTIDFMSEMNLISKEMSSLKVTLYFFIKLLLKIFYKLLQIDIIKHEKYQQI